jgi:hypothetical protein
MHEIQSPTTLTSTFNNKMNKKKSIEETASKIMYHKKKNKL